MGWRSGQRGTSLDRRPPGGPAPARLRGPRGIAKRAGHPKAPDRERQLDGRLRVAGAEDRDHGDLVSLVPKHGLDDIAGAGRTGRDCCGRVHLEKLQQKAKRKEGEQEDGWGHSRRPAGTRLAL